jgi:hypothetical protein
MKVNLTDQIKPIIKQKPVASRFAILYQISAINRQKYNKPPKCLTIPVPQTANA